jgi:hypothetical protein
MQLGLTIMEFTMPENLPLKAICHEIVKKASALGVFTSAAISSCVGNRNIFFKALYDDGTVISTVEANGYLLTQDNLGTRKAFDAFYNDAFTDPIVAKKLVSYWLIWLTDISGNCAPLVAQLCNAFVQDGVELPVKIVKYTTIRSTKKGKKSERTVKHVFTCDVLRAELSAIVGDGTPENIGIVQGNLSWIKNSPTRSSKYNGNSDAESEDTVLDSVDVEIASPATLAEFDL